MKKNLLLLLALVFPLNTYAAKKDGDYFKDETLESCYQKKMSAAVQNCMIYLSDKKKQEYDKQYHLLLENAWKRKDQFHNYTLFINAMAASERHWQNFIDQECLAQAYLDEIESFAFYTDKNACLIKAYSERMKFLKNYQF